MFVRPRFAPLLAASLFLASTAAYAQQPGATVSDGSQAWYTFAGQLNAQKYAIADQINPDNVGKLATAWEFHSGDVSDGKDPNGPGLGRNPALRQRHALRVDRVRPHLRARAGHRQGQVDL